MLLFCFDALFVVLVSLSVIGMAPGFRVEFEPAFAVSLAALPLCMLIPFLLGWLRVRIREAHQVFVEPEAPHILSLLLALPMWISFQSTLPYLATEVFGSDERVQLRVYDKTTWTRRCRGPMVQLVSPARTRPEKLCVSEGYAARIEVEQEINLVRRSSRLGHFYEIANGGGS